MLWCGEQLSDFVLLKVSSRVEIFSVVLGYDGFLKNLATVDALLYGITRDQTEHNDRFALANSVSSVHCLFTVHFAEFNASNRYLARDLGYFKLAEVSHG